MNNLNKAYFSGTLQEELICWRPRGDSIIYELRRFFIGGSPELEDISYACIPSDHEVRVSSFCFLILSSSVKHMKYKKLSLNSKHL